MDSVGGEHEVISGKRRPSRKGGGGRRMATDGDGSYIDGIVMATAVTSGSYLQIQCRDLAGPGNFCI